MAINWTGRPTLPGDTIHGKLYFRALAPMSQDYTVFVHLTQPQEVNTASILAQEDRQPADGNFPTSAWAPGDIVVHDFTLVAPPNAPPGSYPLRIGFYDLTTGQRLATFGGDEVVLGPISIR